MALSLPSTSNESSFFQLSEDLVSHRMQFLCNRHNRESYEKSARMVRKKLYNLYFAFINGPHKHSSFSLHQVTKEDVCDELYVVVFALRRQHDFDMAHEILRLGNILLNASEEDPIFLQHLHFLLLMKSSHVAPVKSRFGMQTYAPPACEPEKRSPETEEDICYGDSRAWFQPAMNYTLYPDWSLSKCDTTVSWNDVPTATQWDVRLFQEQSLMVNIPVNPFLDALNHGHRGGSCEPAPLLGALNNATDVDLNSPLFIMDIPDLLDFGPSYMRPRNVAPFTKLLEPDPASVALHCVVPMKQRVENPLLRECDGFTVPEWNQFQKLFQENRGLRFTWEMRATPQSSELPYLSESLHIPLAFHSMLRIFEERYHLIPHEHPLPLPIQSLSCGCCTCANTIQFDSVSHVARCVLLAFLHLTSNLLQYDPIHRVYRLVDESMKLHVPHLSGEAIRQWFQSYILYAASNAARLSYLCDHLNALPGSNQWLFANRHGAPEDVFQAPLLPYHGDTREQREDLVTRGSARRESGLVYRAWAHALRQVLLTCRSAVLTCLSLFYENPALLSLHSLLIRLRKTFVEPVNHLARSLRVDWYRWDGRSVPDIPRGLPLIRMMYDVCSNSYCTDQYYRCLILFKHAALPFLKFLEIWAFQGIHVDTWKEFGIELNENISLRRDLSYWTSFYMHNEPWTFLPTTFSQDVFRCGKSLHFLRTVSPNHYLFTKCKRFPSLGFPLDGTRLDELNADVEAYVQEMNEYLWNEYITREQKRRELEEAQRQLIKRAKEATAATLKRLEEMIHSQRDAEDKKKRSALSELLSQAEEASKRREEDLVDQTERDARYIEELLRRENELKTFDARIEKEARDELIEYYENLTAEATQREMRAIWRMERNKLHPSGEQLGEVLRQDELILENDELLSEKNEKVNESKMELDDTIFFPTNITPVSHLSETHDKESDNSTPSSQGHEVSNKSPSSISVRKNATDESDHTQSSMKEQERIRAFKLRNPKGHSSDSTMKELLSREPSTQTNGDRVSKNLQQNQNSPHFHSAIQSPSLSDRKIRPSASTYTLGDSSTDQNYNNTDQLSQQLNNSAVIPYYNSTKGISNYPHKTDSSPLVLWKSETDLRSSPTTDSRRSSRRGSRANASQAQHLLYGPTFGSTGKSLIKTLKDKKKKKKSSLVPVEDWAKISDEISQHRNTLPAYTTFHDQIFNAPLMTDLLSCHRIHKSGDELSMKEDEEKTAPSNRIQCRPLHEYIERVFIQPLVKQIQFVDTSLLDYFLVDLAFEEHLNLLKRFLLLDDGVFSLELVHELSIHESIASLSPGKLNAILQNCLPHHSRTNSSIKDIGSLMSLFWVEQSTALSEAEQKSNNPFVPLQLQYTVEWPLNIAIPKQVLHSYNRIFTLLIFVKHADWALRDCFLILRSAEYSAPHLKPRLFRLFCHRGEMEHCVKVIQTFLHHQASEIAWKELMTNMATKVHSLDDLLEIMEEHVYFLLYRCFLTNQWRELLSSLESVLHEILHFHEKLKSIDWSSSNDSVRSRLTTTTGSYVQFKSRLTEFLIILGCFVGQPTPSSMEESSMFVVKEGGVEHNAHLLELVVRFHGNDFYSSNL